MAAERNEAKEVNKKVTWSRRDFFSCLEWGGFAFFGFAGLIGFIRSAFPRVLFQPPTRFKAGKPEKLFGEFKDKDLIRFAPQLFAKGSRSEFSKEQE